MGAKGLPKAWSSFHCCSLLGLPKQLGSIPNLIHAHIRGRRDLMDGHRYSQRLAGHASACNRDGESIRKELWDVLLATESALVVTWRRTKKDVNNQAYQDSGPAHPSGWQKQRNGTKTHKNHLASMLRRVTNRHRGVKEGDMVRLVQASVLSRITFAARIASPRQKRNNTNRRAHTQDTKARH